MGWGWGNGEDELEVAAPDGPDLLEGQPATFRLLPRPVIPAPAELEMVIGVSDAQGGAPRREGNPAGAPATLKAVIPHGGRFGALCFYPAGRHSGATRRYYLHSDSETNERREDSFHS